MNNTMPPSPTPGHAPLGARLAFLADSFIYDRKTYPYAEVRNMEFMHTRHTLRGRDGQDRVAYESRWRVKIVRPGKRGKWMVLRLVRPIFNTQKTYDKAAHEEVLLAAEMMAARTFDARMDAYMDGFAARRYLGWGNFQICPNGDLFRRFAFCMNLRDPDVTCLMFADRLACLRKPRRWWKRVLWSLVKAGETIDLQKDKDCFLYFMRRHVGLWWPNETLRLWHGKMADGSNEAPRAKAEAPKEERQAPPPPPPEPKPMMTHVQHLVTLGLGPDVTWEVVRTTYRGLARTFHPDLVRGRGAGAAEVKQAENKLKAINEAYGWLEDFYRLKPKAGR